MHTHTCAQTDTHNRDPFSGLIIDAFGELRDQQEQVKEDMEVRFDTFFHSQHRQVLYWYLPFKQSEYILCGIKIAQYSMLLSDLDIKTIEG